MNQDEQSTEDKSARSQITPLNTSESPSPNQPATEQQLQEAERKIEKRMSAFERSMLRLTRAAVVISFLTAFVFAGQLYEMITGSTQTDKLIGYAQTQSTAASDIATASGDFTGSAYWMEQHMDDAATAIQDSVDTADRNTRTTIQNAQAAFRQDQRAWVGVREVESKEFAEGSIWKVTVHFVNSGKSPARNVQISAMFITSDVPLRGPSEEHVKSLVFRPAQSIAPGGSYHEQIGQEIPAEPSTTSQKRGMQTLVSQYQAIKNKQLLLYYFGILKYDDVSGQHRETQYCILLANPDTKEAGFCDSFNDLH
jgi:hypothetical protein